MIIYLDSLPLLLIDKVLNSLLPQSSMLEFSKYVYVEKGITLSREIIQIEKRKFSEEWFSDQLASLNKQQEFAFHSKVIINRRTFHFPLIDFNISVGLANLNKIKSSLEIPNVHKSDLYLYYSGNSYHGYVNKMLEVKDWIQFLGYLLLCNNSKNYNYELIDSRWVGHCLNSGFSALRLSNNTQKYNHPPRFVTKFKL